MAYKLGFITWIFSNFLQVSVSYYLWKAIFNSSEQGLISGFTFFDMQVYIIMSFLCRMLTLFSVGQEIAYEISDGRISTVLLKPISYVIRMIFESLGRISVMFFIIAIPTWSFMVIFRNMIYDIPSPSFSAILMLFISLALSFLIGFSIGLCAFFVTYIWGFLICKEAIFMLLSGAIIPLSMFSPAIHNVLQYLPFVSWNYIPIMIYMQKLEPSQILTYLAIQLFWVITLTVLLRIFWKAAIKRLSIVGG